jgi:hypothetical protein
MSSVHKRRKLADYREILGITTSTVIEIKWCNESEIRWDLATIHKYDTGKTHNDIPVVSIHYVKEKAVYHDICFVDSESIYDVETDSILSWRFFDNGTEESEYDNDSITLFCEDENDLKKQIDEFVPRMILSVLQKYRDRVDALSAEAVDKFTNQALVFKEVLSNQIFQHFVKSGGIKEGQVIYLTDDDVNGIIKNCLDYMNI